MTASKTLVIVLAFLLGVIIGSLAQRPADAQTAVVLFGRSATGAAISVAVDAAGNLNVIAN